ncbi:MAG: hypothetical protein IJ837_04255 [Clostridia bacterium]|nr:hypothetical protein [Clostridia bacterium]
MEFENKQPEKSEDIEKILKKYTKKEQEYTPNRDGEFLWRDKTNGARMPKDEMGF